MVKDFHVVEEKASIVIKHVSFDGTEVRRRDPNLLRHHLKVDEAALNVADEYQEEDDKQPFQLTLDLHGLL